MHSLTQEVDIEVEGGIDQAHAEPHHTKGDDLWAEGQDHSPDGQDAVGYNKAGEKLSWLFHLFPQRSTKIK